MQYNRQRVIDYLMYGSILIAMVWYMADFVFDYNIALAMAYFFTLIYAMGISYIECSSVWQLLHIYTLLQIGTFMV